MAKQSHRQPPASPIRKTTKSPKRATPAFAAAAPSVRSPANAKPNGPVQRSSYVEAVAVYEQGMRTLQQRNFARAAELLSRVVKAYPEEKELAERARLYLALCERQTQPLSAEPQSVNERLYAATLALNGGDVGGAIIYLEEVLKEEVANDQALYMLAGAYATRGQTDLAVGYLQRAIATNPENRALARTDPDLAALRADEAVAALLEGRLQPVDADRRRTSSPRGGR